jgi:hypothetical protein
VASCVSGHLRSIPVSAFLLEFVGSKSTRLLASHDPMEISHRKLRCRWRDVPDQVRYETTFLQPYMPSVPASSYSDPSLSNSVALPVPSLNVRSTAHSGNHPPDHCNWLGENRPQLPDDRLFYFCDY